MERYLDNQIRQDSDEKIILISGPRQSGKTTLSQSLFEGSAYLNYDLDTDRELIAKKYWSRDVPCIIFDELHKMRDWKRWIKGIYDSEGIRPRIIVTGSANMDAFTKVGDSLAGRYFQFRLHPIDVKEGAHASGENPRAVVDRILTTSGFPEPYLKGSETYYRRWRRTHLDVILRQDFLDMSAVRSIRSIELLIELLMGRASSPVSYLNLSRDLQVDSKTVKAWTMLLENYYVLFSVTPYHQNIARAILKEPKYYFFDVARVAGVGARLENLVACCLLKAVHELEDMHGYSARLHYVRTRNNQEIDFLIAVDGKPVLLLEVKTSDQAPSPHFPFFMKALGLENGYQLVLNSTKEFDTPQGVHVRDLAKFLASFSLIDFVEGRSDN